MSNIPAPAMLTIPSTDIHRLTPEQLRDFVSGLLPQSASEQERVAAIEAALLSPAGPMLRKEIGRWIVEQLVPVGSLVPENYSRWHLPVRDAMLFVVSRLSARRLAPKLLEQVELPLDTPSEQRLLRLISRVPGLQKLGQVVARNRHLRPSVRKALSELENGIRDVSARELIAIVRRELGPTLNSLTVEIEPELLSEASVSGILQFTWQPSDGRPRRTGVFKVLKPHVPECFAEDMDILQRLARYFGVRHRRYGFAAHILTDTFTKVRRLLEHEVDFAREQATLLTGCDLYRSIKGIRVPTLIPELCTSTITAMTREHGAKVTDAASMLPASHRREIAGKLVEAVIAAPLLSGAPQVMFHADPHAGNLLYDSDSRKLVILDWALTERLSREQRRHIAMLVVMVTLRNRAGVVSEIESLSQRGAKHRATQAQLISDTVAPFIDSLPMTRIPDAVDAMRLIERVAMGGVRFPAPLIMFSKAVFTLEGILDEISGPGVSVRSVLSRSVAQRWLSGRSGYSLPLNRTDWIRVQVSALLFGGRLWTRWEEVLLRHSPLATNRESLQDVGVRGNV